jgi:hypothetical protein
MECGVGRKEIYMRHLFFCALALFLLPTALTCFSQQTEITQFAAFGAYSYLSTPSLNLTQRGFDGDFGYNLRSWLTLGSDFSVFNSHTSLLPNDLNPATQAKLAPFLPLLPPGFTLAVPYNSSTYTYEAGPQFNYRRLKKVTFFARPALGLLHAKFEAKPSNPIAAEIVSGLLNGSSSRSDTVVFYGFGGGFTWEVNPHFGIRGAADFARYDFFSNLLNGPRNSVRISVGTKFGFGKNILQTQR